MISSLIVTVTSNTCFAGTCVSGPCAPWLCWEGALTGKERRGGRFGIHVVLVSFVTRSTELIH